MLKGRPCRVGTHPVPAWYALTGEAAYGWQVRSFYLPGITTLGVINTEAIGLRDGFGIYGNH